MTNEPQTDRAGVTVRKVAPADIEGVADVLGRAFDDDPVMNYLARQDGKRSARIRLLMHVGLTKLTLPFGECYVTADFEGAALWNPPGQRPHGVLNDLKLLPDLVRIAGLRGVTRAIGALDFMEKRHPEEPHYYLLGIGVDPGLQGRSIGTQLMAPILERCDREGMPAYLESSKERNLPLYERNGFRVTEQVQLPKGGPPAWLMWRDPA
ncbi:MAG: GNAT family N-acetyltransferase [Planctomycetota bacterium]|nr:GNAT family N-acetyltransferase [Planctomycetota bacterium]